MTPAMIDDKSFNLNDWEMLVVFKITQELQNCFNMQAVYVDNWEVTEKRFKERFAALTADSIKQQLNAKNIDLDNNVLSSVPFIAEHQADERYTIVGAASILSKTSSDVQYKQYKQEFGNFGSGSPADPQTRLFVWQHRHNPPHIIRKSWNTYKMLVDLEKIEDDSIYARKQKITD